MGEEDWLVIEVGGQQKISIGSNVGQAVRPDFSRVTTKR